MHREEKPSRCHWMVYCNYNMLNMFRELLCPSSGARDYLWCGRKVTILTTLCTNRKRCCLPLHMAFRLTPAVDSVQVWTWYSCYAIVESVWSEVEMDRQKFKQSCVIKFCVKLGESATVTYEMLQRAYGEHSLFRAKVFRWHKSFLKGREQVEDESCAGRPST